MRALSIRQPFAELILRGVKTVEYRSRRTHILGERFWIYASRGKIKREGAKGEGIWSVDLSVPGEPLPGWMLELAQQVRLIEPGTLLPTGVIVGSAVVDRCTPLAPSSFRLHPYYQWHLRDVRRAEQLRRPTRQPQPAWFVPF